MSIENELADKLRASGVRVEERLELLRVMSTESGTDAIAKRIAELDRRIRQATKRVAEGLA